MAKDPAMLWYWSDWHSGTTILSRFLKGCYMDVLHAQFNSGRLTLEEIKTVLGSDFGQSWPALQKKFAVDDTGKYFNVRLETEKEKRAAYTASRKKNLKTSHMEPHMTQHMRAHMDNENGNGIKAVYEVKKGSAEGKKFSIAAKLPSDDSATFQDYEYWTKQVIARNDEMFAVMMRNEGMRMNDNFEPTVKGFLGLLAQYPKKAPPDQHRWRVALIEHLRSGGKTDKPKGISKDDLANL
jgi:hypothetical protein